MRARASRAAAAVVILALATAGCTGGGDNPEPVPTPTSESASDPVHLTFGVYGPRDEVDAFGQIVEGYNSLADGNVVELRSWSGHDGLLDSLKAGRDVPDVFMVSRGDLAWLQENQLNQPVDELLDERGVDFGDGYSRDALQAFSAANRLQCMPFGISPMVVYYNKDLVDFDRMLARGLDAPELADPADDPGRDDARWTFDQFAAAASFATRPRNGTRGLYVDPTLRGLAPFIYSGGGTLFDDENAPTSLAFSDTDTRAALTRSLELLRDPQLTLTDEQLDEASGLEWFKRGKLGMIEGFRSLVPELRQVQGLEFDVMPMPTLDGSATIGDITGLCLSSDSVSTTAAADFMVHALSAPAVRRVVRTGYLAPANLEVALSPDFLQPGRLPAHSGVFNSSVRSMEIPPLLDSWTDLEAVVANSLRQLLRLTVLDLDALTERIDEQSRAVLDPENASESPE